MSIIPVSQLKSLFFEFPLAKGNYSFCNHHGYSIVPQTIAFNMPDNEVRIKKPQIDETTEGRLEEIAQAILLLAEEKNIVVEQLKPLDHGKKGVAIDTGTDYVVRIQLGELPERVKQEWLLQPVAYKFDKDLNVTIEILEKLEMGNVSFKETSLICAEAIENGYTIWDNAPQNFARKPNGKVVYIDPDGFSKRPSY